MCVCVCVCVSVRACVRDRQTDTPTDRKTDKTDRQTETERRLDRDITDRQRQSCISHMYTKPNVLSVFSLSFISLLETEFGEQGTVIICMSETSISHDQNDI